MTHYWPTILTHPKGWSNGHRHCSVTVCSRNDGTEMKEWVVIHKIKALHDGGGGLSVRNIATELGISRNTVRKYLRMHEEAIGQTLTQTARHKGLDAHRDYIVHLLRTYPNLSAVKVARKLRQKLGELAVSDRSIRRYMQAIKREVATAQRRYYEPVLDDIPGVQCQVDPGELHVYTNDLTRIG